MRSPLLFCFDLTGSQQVQSRLETFSVKQKRACPVGNGGFMLPPGPENKKAQTGEKKSRFFGIYNI
jgi:hypothetical protein